jgi:hypothetical protein
MDEKSSSSEWTGEREEAEMEEIRSDVTYDLGILFLLGTIRPQHGFSLINSHTSPLDDLEVFQPRDNLPFNPRDQLDQR